MIGSIATDKVEKLFGLDEVNVALDTRGET